MKTLFNKFMMVIVAVVMVIGFSAFKIAEANKTLIEVVEKNGLKLEYWRFTSDDLNDITNPLHYELKEIDEPDCDGTSIVCEIFAPSDGDYPDLNAIFESNQTYADLIEEAMSGVPTTNEVVIGLKN